MTIYDRLITEVECGKRFSIDLKAKTLKIGKEVVINEGNYSGELIGDLPKDPLELVEDLFRDFYFSRPGAWSEKKKSYFASKNVNEMTDIELACGEPRLVAQAKLEGFILCTVLSGVFEWNPRFGNWFWKSRKYPRLVLLKEWF